MRIKDFIQTSIPTITTQTSGNMAILTMEEYKTPVLIILDEDKLIGLVKENDILEMSDLSKPINPVLLNKQTIYLEIGEIYGIFR